MLWGSALFAGLGLVVAVEAGWTAAGARGGAAVAAVVLTLVVVYPPVVLDPGWNPHLGTVWMLATVGLAWAVGAGIALLGSAGLLRLTGVAALDALLVTALLYAILRWRSRSYRAAPSHVDV